MNMPKEEPLIFITYTDEYNEGCYYGCGIEKDYEKAKIEQFRELDFQIEQERYDRKISKNLYKKSINWDKENIYL